VGCRESGYFYSMFWLTRPRFVRKKKKGGEKGERVLVLNAFLGGGKKKKRESGAQSTAAALSTIFIDRKEKGRREGEKMAGLDQRLSAHFDQSEGRSKTFLHYSS